MMRPGLVLTAIAALCNPAFADDGVESAGLLSDTDLWQLVACGVPPGRPCQDVLNRWPVIDGKPLTIALMPPEPGMPPTTAEAIRLGVDQAIVSINTARSGIRLARAAPGQPGDITLIPTALTEGSVANGISGIADGDVIGVGYMTFWSDDTDMITNATILISSDIAIEDVASVVLEEIVQTLGLPFDINNADYHGVSIFSQTSNNVVTISGQDAVILRLHYPPAN